MVTRTALLTLPAGDHRLIVRGLPDPLDPGTLRLSARNANVRLGGIEIQKITNAEYASEAERALRAKLRGLEDQKAALADEIAAATTQLKLLDTFAEAPKIGSERPAVDAATLGNALTTVGTGASAARAKIRDANIRNRELDEQIQALHAELQKIQTSRKATTEVRANIGATQSVTAPIAIEYQVKEAGWEWLYEARLDSEQKKVGLTKQAAVRQGTGEDWTNVELTVTTSRPTRDAATPAIASLFLESVEPSYAGGGGELEEIVVTGLRQSIGSRRTRRAARDDSDDDEQNTVVTAEVSATEFIADYRVPGRVTVGADRQTRLYSIGDQEFDVELVARAVLSAERSARLEATFTYGGDIPLEDGRVQLYRDGAFIGFAKVPIILPGADVRMPFGIDERIRIVVRDEREQSGKRGVITKQQLEERKRRFEVTSYHANALPIELIDRVPVAKQNDIRVEVLDGATPPTTKNLDGQEGVYLWRLPGTPRQTETIRHYYSVRFPRGHELVPSEST